MMAPIAFYPPVWRSVFLALLASTAAPSSPAAVMEPELLEPEKAFRISTRALDEDNVEVRFEIADGYYMYRDRFRFETMSGRVLADVELPKGKVKDDPFFGRTETYRREARIRVPVTAQDLDRGTVKLKVTSQGCADVGVCYTPLEQFVEVRIAGPSPSPAPTGASQVPSWLADAQRVTRSALARQTGSYIAPGTLLAILAAFFVFGLVASFVRLSTAAHERLRQPVDDDLLRVSVRFLLYTVLGVAAGVAGRTALGGSPGTTESTMLAVAFAGLGFAAMVTHRAAVVVTTAAALLFVAKTGSAILGAAGMGLLALSLGAAPRLARWRNAPAAARWLQLSLGFTAVALALWTASP